ncbi:hypothetical protein RN001_004868 [Aquatica leii]|uniref:Uncharacterized protein n=1 Tax=Aquatica leii TaxID=1421715 RepID=A0AAN7SI75_9COLE|nr:hypothetical protein RN001_004868 [Aquatica leii]
MKQFATLQEELAKDFLSKGGSNLAECVERIMPLVLTDETATLYSFHGHKRKQVYRTKYPDSSYNRAIELYYNKGSPSHDSVESGDPLSEPLQQQEIIKETKCEILLNKLNDYLYTSNGIWQYKLDYGIRINYLNFLCGEFLETEVEETISGNIDVSEQSTNTKRNKDKHSRQQYTI